MLTQEQIKSNIDSMEKQGAKPEEIQGWLDSLKTSQSSMPSIPAEQPKNYSIGEMAGSAIKNIPGSIGNLIGGIGSAVAHPINTINTITDIGRGALAQIPGVEQTAEMAGFKPEEIQADKQKFQSMTDYFSNRYGGVENIKRTIAEDPAGFALDLSMFLDAGASAAGKIGEVSKIGAISKAGEVAGKIGEVVDPLATTVKVASKVGGFVKKGTGWMGSKLGGLLTGVGTQSVKDFSKIMSEGTKEERAVTTGMMRSADAFKSTYNSIVEAAQNFKAERGANFKASLSKLDNITSFDVTPLIDKMKNLVEDYTKKPFNGKTADFSLSGVKAADVPDLQKAVNLVNGRLKMPKGRTLDGLDSLKQDLYNLTGGLSDKAKSFVMSLYGETKNILTENVKGYAEMEADYAQKSADLQELVSEFSGSNIKKSLGMGGVGKFTSGIKRVMSIARDNDSFRRDLLSKLKTTTDADQNLLAKLTGASFSPLVSEGGIGKLAEGLSVVGAVFAPAEIVHLAALFIATSPRVMGEFMNVLGYGSRANKAFKEFISTPAGEELQKALKAGYYTNQANPPTDAQSSNSAKPPTQ